MLNKQQGVHVGNTSRSIFERAGEQEPPKFNSKMVVASFQDAKSWQLSEAVRIDLRGENVLNLKSDYSRCKVPRLIINKEECIMNDGQKKKKYDLVDSKKVDEDII